MSDFAMRYLQTISLHLLNSLDNIRIINLKIIMFPEEAMFTFQRAIPEEAGIASSSIKDLLLFLESKNIPMHSLLIMRKERLVFEKYYAPYKASTLHRMFSISKSFTALSIFLLADEKRISLDDPIIKYYPEYVNENTHKWIKETTIRNMLMMRTCHASTTYKVDMKSNWVESFFIVPPTHKPGTVFHYDTSAAHVLCALVEKLTHMPMLDYMKEKFLNYLDFSQDSYMVKDPFGVSIGGSGLMATPMDILKVLYVLDKKGRVICNDGVERTLINPEFIELATSDLSDTLMTGPLPSESAGYGMQIWQNEMGGFVMYGMGGQLAISLPDEELLIMTTADTQGIAGGNQVIYDGIYKYLLQGIHDNESGNQGVNISSSKPDDYKDLMDTADNLRISMPRVPGKYHKIQAADPCSSNAILPDNIMSIAQKSGDSYELRYNLDDNRQGFSTLTLSLSDKESVLTLGSMLQNNSISIRFGLQEMLEGDIVTCSDPSASIKPDDTHFAAGAIWLRENVLYIRVHLIDECVGSLRFELYFGEDDVTVFMRKIEETYFKEFDGHLYGKLTK